MYKQETVHQVDIYLYLIFIIHVIEIYVIECDDRMIQPCTYVHMVLVYVPLFIEQSMPVNPGGQTQPSN